MSAAQGFRRAAAPLRRCAAWYLGVAAPISRSMAASDGASGVSAAAAQFILSRSLSNETDSGLLSQSKATPIALQNPGTGLYLRRTGDISNVAADNSPGSVYSSPDGSQRVAARISNAPKFMFKSDLLWFLKGCNLRPEDLVTIYDTKYRPRYIQVTFNSVESFRLGQRSLAMKGRLGGRYLKLTQEEAPMDDINVALHQFRGGRSLLMVKVPLSALTEDVERFFAGYLLDTNYPIKFLRFNQVQPGGKRPSAVAARPDYEMRALVRFRTETEALRALREKQGSFCLEKSMDLRYIE